MQDRQNQQTSGNVRVVVRFRPLNEREKSLGAGTVHELYDSKSVVIKEYRNDKPDKPEIHNFNFDRTFDVNANQQEVYTYAAKPVVDSVLEGFNGTVFAYGQTASGKTHTMEGSSIDGDEQAGIIPRMIKHVFDSITNSPDSLEFRIRVSMVQLYMEKLRDLLDVSKNDLKIRSDKKKGIYIEDLTENYISEPDEVFDMMKIAQVNRAICATNMNERSSRSHMIFILTISQNNLQDLSAKTGKLYLVDLAGSEKVGKTGAEGKILDEAKKINTSLATLGKVINALTDGKSTHIPYRDSKLTRVLQESLGGNSKTTLIVTCSPHHYNLPQTLSTLRFGVSAKNIKNKPKINRELTVAELQLLLEKAEVKIADKDKQVIRLEEYIKNELKAKLPLGNAIESTPTEISIEDVEDERFKTIQNQLEIERNNNIVMTQKIGTLKSEMGQMVAKLQQLQRQNSSLLDKVVTLQSTAQAQDKAKSAQDMNIQLLKKIFDTTTDQNTKKLLEPIVKVQAAPTEVNPANQAAPAHTSAVSQAILQELQQNYEAERQRRKKAEEQIAKNEKDLKKKINSLENNIQQLTTVYYDLFVEQSKWKVENAINLRRIEKKNLLIASMENTINDLREQLEQKQLSDDSEDSFDLKQITRAKEIKALKQFSHSKLVKPVRGGKPKP